MAPGPVPGDASAADETLALADWRRRIADLYADVRRIAATDPAAALALWRDTRERLYREHAQSPVPPAERAAFRARHFDHDQGLRFEVAVEPDETATDPHDEAPPPSGGLALPMSVGGTMSFRRIGHVTLRIGATERRLGLFWMAGYAGGLFLPFRDATNGRETYGAGRYILDAAKAADLGAGTAPGSLVLDFNFAFQPSCAFDPQWACPLAPPENRLDFEVRAGERIA